MATVQSLLNPLQQALGHGCHLRRLIDQIICVQSIRVRSIQTFHLKGGFFGQLIIFVNNKPEYQTNFDKTVLCWLSTFPKVLGGQAIGLQI